ncbi:hypothetical protein QJS10_CPB19g00776 [Acorus calamus]|uniref:Uncharacterized protein n=1 Tax=Acorus calamus TaxID=4465 RepID=A0AAV9CGW4_ACOCL|nr:hypothetical protein QJS10_CPB19g00776 [Acorus calamus]
MEAEVRRCLIPAKLWSIWLTKNAVLFRGQRIKIQEGVEAFKEVVWWDPRYNLFSININIIKVSRSKRVLRLSKKLYGGIPDIISSESTSSKILNDKIYNQKVFSNLIQKLGQTLLMSMSIESVVGRGGRVTVSMAGDSSRGQKRRTKQQQQQKQRQLMRNGTVKKAYFGMESLLVLLCLTASLLLLPLVLPPLPPPPFLLLFLPIGILVSLLVMVLMASDIRGISSSSCS